MSNRSDGSFRGDTSNRSDESTWYLETSIENQQKGMLHHSLLTPQKVPSTISLATNFALSAIGPGFLTLPFALSVAGLPLSGVFLVISTVISGRCVALLVQARNLIHLDGDFEQPHTISSELQTICQRTNHRNLPRNGALPLRPIAGYSD